MRLDTVINKTGRMRRTITGVMQHGIYQRHSHAEILDRIDKYVYRTADYKSLPRYAHSRLQGYVEGYFDAIWNNCVTWHVKENGEYVTSKDVTDWANVKPGAMLWNNTKEVYS